MIDKPAAIRLLGDMHGGYNIATLVELLSDDELAKAGNANARAVMQSWADGEWFTSRPEVPESIKTAVFKVTGETTRTTCRRRPTPGAARTFRCTPAPCTK